MVMVLATMQTKTMTTAITLTDDMFPLDANEQHDTDNDGLGDNADTDDDGDGYADIDEITCFSDALDKPLNPSGHGLGLPIGLHRLRR